MDAPPIIERADGTVGTLVQLGGLRSKEEPLRAILPEIGAEATLKTHQSCRAGFQSHLR